MENKKDEKEILTCPKCKSMFIYVLNMETKKIEKTCRKCGVYNGK